MRAWLSVLKGVMAVGLVMAVLGILFVDFGVVTDVPWKYFEQEIKCRGGNYVLIRNMDDCVAFVNEDLVEPVKARFQANITNIWTDINNGSAACSPAQKALPPFKDIKE